MMAITKLAPHTILLWGDGCNMPADLPASVAITPGMLCEMVNSSGLAIRPNSSATAQCPTLVALNQKEMNKGIDDVYAIGDLVQAVFLEPGNVFLGIIPSGQNVTVGDPLQSNGDGKLKAATASTAAANVYRFQALETTGAVVADTRVRVQVVN